MDLIFDRDYLQSLFAEDGEKRVSDMANMVEEADRFLEEPHYPYTKSVDPVIKNLRADKDETLLTLLTFAALNRCGEESWKSILTKVFPNLGWNGSDGSSSLSIQLEKGITPKRSQPFLKYQTKSHPLKYVREVGADDKEPEGKAHFDAVISVSGINIFAECRFTSDIPYETTHVTNRNQIARHIDVGLDSMDDDVDHFYFLLITPKRYQEFPGSRFYYYKMREYQSNPIMLALDIPRFVAWLEHEKKHDRLGKLNSHIGWMTWEELVDVILKCEEITPEERRKLKSFYRDRMLIDHS